RHRARTLDRVGELTLVSRAAARDPARNDLAALGHEAAQAPDVFVVDEIDFVRTEFADLSPAEPAALHGLRCGRNGAPPLTVRTAHRRRRRRRHGPLPRQTLARRPARPRTRPSSGS